jgi:hypothetical protein
MKKVLVHLSMLCLMAALVLSLGACKKEEMEVEEAPAATDAMEPAMTEPAMTDTGAMGSEPMMTDTGAMGTETGTEPPPAQ